MPLTSAIPTLTEALKRVPEPGQVYMRTLLGMIYAGSRRVSTLTAAADDLDSDNEGIILAAPTANQTLTLPAAASNGGRLWYIKNVSASYNVTIHTADDSDETIDGVNSDQNEEGMILNENECVFLYCDGTEFWLLQKEILPRVVTTTGATTLRANCVGSLVILAGAHALTLPDATVVAGKALIIHNSHTADNDVKTPASTDQEIDGVNCDADESVFWHVAPNQTIVLRSDGSDWVVESKKGGAPLVTAGNTVLHISDTGRLVVISAAHTVELPAVATKLGLSFKVKSIHSSAVTLHTATDSDETIDGTNQDNNESGFSLAENDCVEVVAGTGDWHVVGLYDAA